MHVERELQELKEQLAQVDEWKRRHEEVEKELAKVWVAGSENEDASEALAAPDAPEFVDALEHQSEKTDEKEMTEGPGSLVETQ